jgi:hypothetical protein
MRSSEIQMKRHFSFLLRFIVPALVVFFFAEPSAIRAQQNGDTSQNSDQISGQIRDQVSDRGPGDFTSVGRAAAAYDDGGTSDTNVVVAPNLFLVPAEAAPSQDDWVHRWLRTVDEVRKEQPHYVAPLITTHVLLVQQFRFDSYWQPTGHGQGSYDFGAQKGLEIIPNSRMEVQVGIPPYIEHTGPMPGGFGDVSIFMKFRAFSAPGEKGDYFVGFFLGGTFPSGDVPNGMGHTVWSPMIAAAKGFGPFDIQTTLSANLPQSGTDILGRQVLFNTTVQYAIHKMLWPELESNSIFFIDGPHSGETESFLTPGLLVGPFQVADRLHFEPGGGVQIAMTQFHQYVHRWIWTLRFPF